MRILIVDDSVLFRTLIAKALAGAEGIENVTTASSGKLALQKMSVHGAGASDCGFDVITIDMEMPEMSGIELIKEIRAKNWSVKPIVFSSQNLSGAQLALEALREGARDIVAKPEGKSGEDPAVLIRSALLPKIMQFSKNARAMSHHNSPVAPVATSALSQPVAALNQEKKEKAQYTKVSLSQLQPTVIVIASSTGGPNALEAVFAEVKTPPKVPIAIVQHMPPVFTDILANRLSLVAGWPFSEAKHNQLMLPGHAYVAPGDYHLEIEVKDGKPYSMLHKQPQRNSVRPAADFLFESASRAYGAKLLGIVLTGMGEDGLVGAKAIKNAGGGIYIQNRETCVVFGMPGAVFDEGCYDGMGDLVSVANQIKRHC